MLASEKGDAAGTLMLRLMALKGNTVCQCLYWLILLNGVYLIQLHKNDLAGSKKLYNFFDSVFAIGKSAKNSSVRYIKQLKVRYGNYTYDADNVIVCVIEKVGTFLQFVDIGYAVEKEHLKEPSEKDSTQEKETIKRMVAEGKRIG